jgi:carboxypeptidase Taq
MDEFDRGLTVKQVDSMFNGLTTHLQVILDKIKEAASPDASILHGHFEKQKQWDFGISLLKEMHYDFEAGRQDISEHPFTIHFGSRDVRVTTRIDEMDFGNMTWSCLHEGGHALYEQGLPEEEYGLPLGESCSLSIHESQSRLWENCIGRSKPYWQYHFPALKNIFPERLATSNAGSFFRAINKVTPSLIRTEADEVTYHFHVLIRYELEKELISGKVSPADIPARWNELYKLHLGVTVPDDKQGCLQDVHWSHGSFGYFPTYSLGSLYAAQFFDAIKKQHGDLDVLVASGNTKPVWNWLQENIFKHGRYFTSSELCRQATGEDLNPKYFIDYITKKVAEVYGLNLPNN